jgi:polyferredoxin
MQCVKVCPTGIDIRNGTQMECVGCTACIDACNTIMDGIGKPQGLIRYASEYGITNKEPLHYTGRMKMYTVLLVLLAGLLTFLLITRKDVDTTVMRTPGILFQEKGADSVSNLYNIKVANKTNKDIPLHLKLEGVNGQIVVVGNQDIKVKASGQGSGTFFVILPRATIHHRKTSIHIALYTGDKKIETVETNFLGPMQYKIK